MRPFRLASVLGITAVAFACSGNASRGPSTITSPDPVESTATSESGGTSSASGTRLSATVQFGLEDVGTGIPAPVGHDQSFHANDTLVPGTVVIDQAGTVTFKAVGIHQVAIYKPGVEPEDIDTSALVAMPCPGLPPLLIDDDQGGNREAFYATGCGPREITHQFNTPGKYLVICAFSPHFEVKMYGWVVVRNR